VSSPPRALEAIVAIATMALKYATGAAVYIVRNPEKLCSVTLSNN
jgi:hypothetical protein